MAVIDPFNKEALEKLIAADPKLASFFSMKFTEALEKFGSAPKETHDWADDPSLSAEEITARFNALPEVTYDFERNVWEVER